MLTDKFTLLELLDLALRVPEVGAINFNILHSTLTHIATTLGIGQQRPLCHIEDETAARLAVARGRLTDSDIKRRHSGQSTSVEGIRDLVKGLMKKEEKVGSKSSVEKKASKVGSKSSVEKMGSKSGSKSSVVKETKSEKDTQATEKSSVEKGEEKETQATDKSSVEKGKEKEKGTQSTVKSSVEKEKETQVTSKPSAEKGTDVKEEAYKEEPSVDKEAETKKEGQVEGKPSVDKGTEVKEEGKIEETDEKGSEPKDDGQVKRKPSVDKGSASKEKSKTEEEPSVGKGTESEEEGGKESHVKKEEEDAEDEQSQQMKPDTDEEDEKDEYSKEDIDDLFGQGAADPTRTVRDMWKTININRRVEGVEKGLNELTTIVDMIVDNLQEVENDTDKLIGKSKKLTDDLDSGVERIKKLEENVNNLFARADDANEFLKNELQRIETTFKGDLSKIKEEMKTNENDMLKRMAELRDLIIPKEDFSELVTRVDGLEKNKVSRDELGRLMEEGFIDKMIAEQENMRKELNELKLKVEELENNLRALMTRIDEEILAYIEDALEEINNNIAAMKEKLDTLDADDINDTFARLEEQADKLAKELENLRLAQSRFEKEARLNFKKISDLEDSMARSDSTKMDKVKAYELLELKADIDMVTCKLDRSEFVAVMQDVEDKAERLTVRVKITEENLEEGLSSLRRALSFKMYTEDFIIATEPIRNRIKAMMHEQERIKEMVLESFMPDAPGVLKCFSCKRAANLTEKKFLKRSKMENMSETSETSKSTNEKIKFPPIDLDSVPIPPADKPRISDIHQLPVLFATARPQIGLAHQKRKKDIDRELTAYFAAGKVMKMIGGAHTKTLPQQRGLTFTTKTLQEKKRFEEVLLKGLDNRIYRGTVNRNEGSEPPEEGSSEKVQKMDVDQPSENTRKIIHPTPVVLHSRSMPIESKTVIEVPSSSK